MWFIAALTLFVLIGSMVDFSCNGWNVSKQFFTDSWWGIIAIASGVLSLLMFYGSSKSYRDVKINETFLDNPDRSKLRKKKGSISMFKKETAVVEFDLSQLTMNTLTKKMAYVMTKPGPVFFKGWGNRRLQLDVERVEIIREYIEAIRATGDSLIHLHADSVLSYEKMENLVNIKRNDLLLQLKESQLKIDLLEKEHQARVDRLRIDVAHLETMVLERIAQIENLNAQTEQVLSDMRNRTKEIDTEIKIRKETAESEIQIKEKESMARIELEKDKASAEIYVMKLKAGDDSDISKKRAKALDMVIEEMNMDSISPAEVYLLIKLLDTSNTTDFIDFENKIKVMGEELEKMRVQNDILKSEAKEKKAKANEVEAQSKQNIKDLYNNR
jgi:cyclophilin family peptidyl-prolyl cis-trans isomerase